VLKLKGGLRVRSWHNLHTWITVVLEENAVVGGHGKTMKDAERD